MSAKKEAAKRLLNIANEAVSGAARSLRQWGFDPADMKPGEMSGTQFVNEYNRLRNIMESGPKAKRSRNIILPDTVEALDYYYPGADDAFKKTIQEYRSLLDNAVNQLSGITKPRQRGSEFWRQMKSLEPYESRQKSGPDANWARATDIMNRFAELENMGVPRRMTAKALTMSRQTGIRGQNLRTVMDDIRTLPAKEQAEQLDNLYAAYRFFPHARSLHGARELVNANAMMVKLPRDVRQRYVKSMDVSLWMGRKVDPMHIASNYTDEEIDTLQNLIVTGNERYGRLWEESVERDAFRAELFDPSFIERLRSMTPDQRTTFDTLIAESDMLPIEVADMAMLL